MKTWVLVWFTSGTLSSPSWSSPPSSATPPSSTSSSVSHQWILMELSTPVLSGWIIWWVTSQYVLQCIEVQTVFLSQLHVYFISNVKIWSSAWCQCMQLCWELTTKLPTIKGEFILKKKFVKIHTIFCKIANFLNLKLTPSECRIVEQCREKNQKIGGTPTLKIKISWTFPHFFSKWTLP